MTTPTRISTETVRGRVFTIDRAIFVTPRGGCGVRLVHRIDRKRVTQAAWLAQRDIEQRFDRIDSLLRVGG